MFVRGRGHVCEPTGAYPGLCRDPSDEKFIACAIEGKADCIISGDRDLLEARLETVRVLSPRQFLTLYLAG